MKRILMRVVGILIVGFLVFLSFSTIMSIVSLSKEHPETDFSVKRAFRHVTQMSKKPHYTGSENHSAVRNYIVEQFQEMGLQVHTQNGYVLNKNHVLTNPENIITRIEGTNPQPGSDLLVLAHYDSAPHSSFGAAD